MFIVRINRGGSEEGICHYAKRAFQPHRFLSSGLCHILFCFCLHTHEMKKMDRINRRLLPIKFHYIFFFGAMGGVKPYMPVIAKNLGITATAVGLIYTILPFCAFFSKPLFGYLADYFRNIKAIIFILVCITALSFASVLFIPPIDKNLSTHVQVECENSSHYLSVLPQTYDRWCLQDALHEGATCEISYLPCYSNSSVTLQGNVSIDTSRNSSLLTGFTENNSTLYLKFKPNTNFTCDCITDDSAFMTCSKPAINSCFITNDQTMFGTLQFWGFALFAIIAGTGAETIFCLSDSACYEILGDHPEDYGRQRLWATFSWGLMSLLAGISQKLTSSNSDPTSYSAGFYLMLVLVFIDLLLLMKIQLKKTNFSTNICKDIGKIFSSCETVSFAISVYIIGGFTGLLWNYLLWYLQDLGAPFILLTMTIAVQCLVGEVPCFFFAGWFIKTFGYFNCLIGSFAAFGLRLGVYYVLQNPWLVLLIEATHGLTFGLFYATMTGYASNKAPPGTEATMMGIFGALFEGLGVATGCLLGGVGFDKIGERNTFLIACIISLSCIPILVITRLILKQLVLKLKRRPIVQTHNSYNSYGTVPSPIPSTTTVEYYIF